ncbi:hypothetical protein [Paenibacillus sp. GCM10023250]|uniref:hypothetical protein n=1 Tax=Paenibacillus sp. GCM10023250 TaxID=3252648 RepID=UPI003610C147
MLKTGQYKLQIRRVFTLVAVDAGGNQSENREVIFFTEAYQEQEPGSLQFSDSITDSDGRYNYEYSLYYGYITTPGQALSGSWTLPEGYHAVVTVSMVSPDGENYDLSLESAGDGSPSPSITKVRADGTEYSTAELPEGYTATWKVKGHTGDDYSPDDRVIVYEHKI